jgi:hypothetical protein
MCGKLKVRRRETKNMRVRHDIDRFETVELNQYCKKTCTYDNFKQYLQLKLKKDNELQMVYGHPMFRQFKFLVYCKQKSSEDKIIHKIKSELCKSSKPKNENRTTALNEEQIENARKATNQLVIGYGNWGANPNLRRNAPTPGIGLRRRFEKHFQVVIVNEYMTSQKCPCCKEEKSLKKHKMNGNEIHHLLCCKNSDCSSRWWNRNVAGSINILERFFEMKKPHEVVHNV